MMESLIPPSNVINMLNISKVTAAPYYTYK